MKNNELRSKNHRKTRTLILASTFSECLSISAFASVVDVSVRIASSSVGLNICVITARIKKYKSIIKKKRKKVMIKKYF